MKFPDFIIIGAMKCGTTVLWHNLNRHPYINMCKNWEDPKVASTEIRFWNNGEPHKTWDKGIDWYKSLFDGDCCGEKSANYIEESISMGRMTEYIPNVKLILNIRNPIDRAYSEYQMQRAKINRPFDMDLVNQRGYLYRGMYYQQINSNVLPFFPKESLYIVIQERMKNNINYELAKLCDFLEVRPHNFEIEETTAAKATDRSLDLNEDGRVRLYKKWHSEYKPMSMEMGKNLSQYFKKHNENLFKFLGYEIMEWESVK